MPDIPFDKFYTPDPTARKCVGALWRVLGMQADDLYIEPSAGAGAFCRHLPAVRLIALDIAPEADGIEMADFLEFDAPAHAGRKIVIGNPPFGRNGALARAFLRHAMSFADIVAYILPASFAKASMQRGIDRRFHLIHEALLDDQHFETRDGDHVVNTVFQIWMKRKVLREIASQPDEQADFAFVQDIRDADLVIRRVGGRAGAVLERPVRTADGQLPAGYSPNSNYYIKALGGDPDVLIRRFQALDLARPARRAVCPSLSKRELVAAYEAMHGVEAVPAPTVTALGRQVTRARTVTCARIGPTLARASTTCTGPMMRTAPPAQALGHPANDGVAPRLRSPMLDRGDAATSQRRPIRDRGAEWHTATARSKGPQRLRAVWDRVHARPPGLKVRLSS